MTDSSAASMASYRAALTAPGALVPAIASLLGRLPIAMGSLAILIYVQRSTGSFAIAGLVSAATLAGIALGSVGQGRLIDRLGPTRPLIVVATGYAAAVTGTIGAVELDAPGTVMVAAALLVGVSQPAVPTASRALWTRLVPAGPVRQAAYTYEAISLEVFFILGPGLAGLLAASPWAGTGLVVTAVCMLFGSVWFALAPAVRAWRDAETTRRDTSLLGVLVYPGMRTLVIAVGGFGVTIGFVEVAVPAFATLEGHRAVGGLLLGLWSISSVVFGIAYASRPWPRPLHLRTPALLTGFGAMVALLALPTSLVGLAVAMLVAGLLITPQSTVHSAIIEDVAPPHAAAEAFGWVITSATLGLAIGYSAAGQLIDASGPRLAFLAAAGCGVLLGGVVWLRRATLRPIDRAETTELVSDPA